jgi:hypothetical protein
LAAFGVAAVLFVPVIGSATILSFLSGSATAFVFRERGTRFVRIYAAWLLIHAALVLATVYSGDVLRDLSEPWLEEVRALETAVPEGAEVEIPPEMLAYVNDWIPATLALTSSLARRASWISLVYAAWLPLLLFAPGVRSQRDDTGLRKREFFDA